MSQNDRVLVDLELDAPVDVLWPALRDPAQIRRWFGWDYDGLPAEIEEIFVAGANADDDAHTITWDDGDRFVLTGQGDRTELKVLRRGHSGTDFDGVYDPIDEGWITFTQQLRFALERHRGEERRTISATGVDLGSEDDPLLARLGLRSLGDDPVGAPYTVERPDGTSFSGEVYFQTDLQVGLTVAEENDALLVIARTPPTSAPPNGAVMFVLSTYGVDGDPEELERRWTGWWAPEG